MTKAAARATTGAATGVVFFIADFGCAFAFARGDVDFDLARAFEFDRFFSRRFRKRSTASFSSARAARCAYLQPDAVSLHDPSANFRHGVSFISDADFRAGELERLRPPDPLPDPFAEEDDRAPRPAECKKGQSLPRLQPSFVP